MAEPIRTFIAVELSEAVRAQIDAPTQPLKQRLSGIRWVATENLHLTFKFLGNVDAEKVGDVLSRTSEAAKGVAPFPLSFSGLGAFPNLKRPRVLWVGVEAGREALIALHTAIETALSQAGFPRDDRAFKPHLTVGRAKSRYGIKGAEEILKATQIRSEPQQVDHITVFRSTLTPQGPIYTALGRYELVGAER